MNTISEQLLQAMEIIADEKVSNLKYDRTVRATIYAVVSVDSGIYQVRFEGNIFTVYAEDLTKRYAVDDEVFVKIPEGDFSNRKIITGKVSETSLSQGQLNQLSNSVIQISPTFDNFYAYDQGSPWRVVAGQVQNEAVEGVDYIYGSEIASYNRDQFHGLFQQYANKYEYIRIKADFKTTFHSEHIKGNYGIEVGFFSKGDDVVKYRLDFQSFVGNPYSFSIFSPQQIIFKVQTNYLLGLKYIKLFQEGFAFDTQISDYSTGARIPVKTIPNIFAQNVEIAYVDVKDLTQETYYAYIAAPKGSVFSPSTSNIDIQARLLSYGEPVNDNKCVYRWFVRDLSIGIGSQEYDKDAGFGWKPLAEKSGTLKVSVDNRIYQRRYKCVIVYDNEVVMTAEKEVINSNVNYDYSIVQITEGDTIRLQLVNNATQDVLTGNWYISYPDGNYSSFSSGQNKNSITVEDYLTYTAVTFYCEVYNYAHSEIAGTVEHTIYNSESQDDVTITYVGEDTFRYDANGDVTIEDSEKERTLQVELAWKEGYGTSYTVEWLGPDGREIPTSKATGYAPKDSMMENIWIDTSNILHYNIKCKFKVNYNNNTFTVKIITIDEKVYTFSKEILFVKDGDQGTNGTTYIAAVRPCNGAGIKLSGFQPLRYTNGWINNLQLRCYVYKDGQPINNDANYGITYKWAGVGVQLSSTDQQQLTVVGSGTVSAATAVANLQRYVKVAVTIDDNTNNRKTMIYASYPIDVLVGNLNPSLVDIDDIPSYIKYTASGVKPSFYSNNITFKYGNYDYTGGTLTTGIQALNNDLLDIEIKDGGKYLKPATNFIFEKTASDASIGVIKCVYNSTTYILHSIIMYLDTYGNEAINGWDGMQLDLNSGYYYMKGSVKVYLTYAQAQQISGGKITINGETYAVHQGDAHIFAPQIGAGEKDSANRFTGVVMGKDSGQSKVGLYGYQAGINTFGLTEDGNAFFGVAGTSGRIELNSEKGTIMSGNYLKTTSSRAGNGMMIDMPKGHIDAYNFLITSKNMTLDSSTGSFEFRLGNSGDSSDQDSQRDKSQFRIYFPKGTYDGVTINSDKNVFYINSNNYYLQTLDYQVENSTQAGKGTRIDLVKGKITSYDFHIKTPTMQIDSGSTGDSKFEFDVSNKGIFDIYATDGTNKHKSLFYVNGALSSGRFYLQSLDYSGGTVNTNGEGTKIDLTKGKITSYSFHLDTPYLTLKSSYGDSTDDAVDDNGKGEFTFNVQNGGLFDVQYKTSSVTKHLIYIKGSTAPSSDTGGDTVDSGNYYLQSYDYNTGNKTGMKIDLAKGRITSYTFKLITNYLTMSSEDTGKFNLNVAGKGQFVVSDDGDNLIYIQGTSSRTPGETSSEGDAQVGTKDKGSFYIQSKDYSTSTKKGTRIDLVNGRITSYVFSLKTNYITMTSDTNGTFTIDVSNGGKFQIKSKYNNSAVTLFNISGTDSSNYYLQSADGNLKFNLGAGKLDAKQFSLSTTYLKLESNETKGKVWFDIAGGGSFQIQDTAAGSGQKTLFNITSGSYYLQSQNFQHSGDDVTGVYINLRSGTSYFGGTITASAGKIGGWRITETQLSNADGSVYINSSGYIKMGGLSITSSGTSITGTVTADSGRIGGWTLSSTGLSGGYGIYLKSDGSMKVGENFAVSTSGVLTVKNASISGAITATAGQIGGWYIVGNFLANTNDANSKKIFLSPSSCNLGNYLTVGAVTIDTTSASTTNNGIGYVKGATSQVTGVGINSNGVVVLDANSHVRITSATQNINLQGKATYMFSANNDYTNAYFSASDNSINLKTENTINLTANTINLNGTVNGNIYAKFA